MRDTLCCRSFLLWKCFDIRLSRRESGPEMPAFAFEQFCWGLWIPRKHFSCESFSFSIPGCDEQHPMLSLHHPLILFLSRHIINFNMYLFLYFLLCYRFWGPCIWDCYCPWPALGCWPDVCDDEYFLGHYGRYFWYRQMDYEGICCVQCLLLGPKKWGPRYLQRFEVKFSVHTVLLFMCCTRHDVHFQVYS